jgi:hypothetical protein
MLKFKAPDIVGVADKEAENGSSPPEIESDGQVG